MNSKARGIGWVTAPRTIDLYSRGPDGRPLLWKRAVQVVPATAFDHSGGWIKSGHYVINHNGDAIVVHCGSVGDHSVSVQFMDEKLSLCVLPRNVIESMLLGRVVVSEEQRAAVFERRPLSNFFNDSASSHFKPPATATKRTVRRRPESE